LTGLSMHEDRQPSKAIGHPPHILQNPHPDLVMWAVRSKCCIIMACTSTLPNGSSAYSYWRSLCANINIWVMYMLQLPKDLDVTHEK
jgi:hypothetical protein